MSEDRRLAVLRAIVQDYVATSEPVGSKSLLERHQLGVSAATVRNDMAVLEEEGLISAPHTSAGRIPTDAGYRLFVDRLSQVRPLTASQRRAIQAFLAQSVDLDDIVERTARLLASLTHQAAVMQYPSLRRSRVRHVELVALAPTKAMLVLILDTGRVEQRIVEVNGSLAIGSDDEFLTRLRRRINEITVGHTLTEADSQLNTLSEEFALPSGGPHAEADVTTIVNALIAAFAEEREERVVLAGTANLTRGGGDVLHVQPVLDALEEHVVLLRLMSALASETSDAVAVRIGAENTHTGLQQTSLVSTTYGSDAVATLGVLGPTRMDYPQTMAAVRAVARYVSQLLEQ